MKSYIIVCEAGDRSCHYWISTASLSLHTTQSATNACGQREMEGEEGERPRKSGRTKAGRDGDVEGERWRERDKAKGADNTERERKR